MSEWDDIEKKIIDDSEKLEMAFQDEFWDEMEALLDENDAQHGVGIPNSDREELFREEYWDEMALILDNDDKKKRRVLWMRWAFDTAAILLLVFTVIHPGAEGVLTNTSQVAMESHTSEHDSETTSERATNQKSTGAHTSSNGTQVSNPHDYASQFSTIEGTDTKVLDEEIRRSSADRSALISASNNHANEPINPSVSSDMEQLRTISFMDLSKRNDELSNSNDLDILRKKLNRRRFGPISINLVMGSNLALAPSGNVSNKARFGTQSSVGLEVRKHYAQWSYGVGANLTHRTGLNHELNLVKSTYGARLYREYQSVQYKSINSVGIPVSMYYHRKRDIFGLKVIPTWNILVNSTYHRYTNYNSDELLVRNNYGIKEGINPFDLQLQLNYQRRLSEKFSVGISVTKGFFNQIDQTIITNSMGLREFSVGINANYTLFRH